MRPAVPAEDSTRLAESFLKDEAASVAEEAAAEKQHLAGEERAAGPVDDRKKLEPDVPDETAVFWEKPTAAAAASSDQAETDHEEKKDKHMLRLGNTYAKKGASLLKSGRGGVQRRAPPPPGSSKIRDTLPSDDAQLAQTFKVDEQARVKTASQIAEEQRKLDDVHVADLTRITEESHAAAEGWKSSPSLERRSRSERSPGDSTRANAPLEVFPPVRDDIGSAGAGSGEDSDSLDSVEPPPYSGPEGDYSLAPAGGKASKEANNGDTIPHPEVPATAGRRNSLKTTLPPQSVYLRRKSVNQEAQNLAQIEADVGVSVLGSVDNSNRMFVSPESRGNRSRTSSLDMPGRSRSRTSSLDMPGRSRSRSGSGSGGSPIVESAPKNPALLEARALMTNQKRRESFVGEAQLAAQATVASTSTSQDGTGFTRSLNVAMPASGTTTPRTRGGSELEDAGHSGDKTGSSPQVSLSALSLSPQSYGVHDNVHKMHDSGVALSYLSSAEIEAKETQRLLELQQAMSERENHEQELQRAEEEEKRQRELRKEEMLKQRQQRQQRKSTSGAGAGLMGLSGSVGPSSLTLSNSSAGSLPSVGVQSPSRANPDFMPDVMHVEADIGHDPREPSVADVSDAANPDSGDEEEQRERERLGKAEQERLSAIESLSAVLPSARRERLLSISKGSTLEAGSAGSSSTGLRDLLTRSASVAEDAEPDQQDADRVMQPEAGLSGVAADADDHVGAAFVI